MRRSERRKYRKRILWGRVILAIIIVFLAGWGGYHLVGYLMKHRFFLQGEKRSLKAPVEKPKPEKLLKKPELAKRLIYLYLPDAGRTKLVKQEKEIIEGSLEDMVREVFKELSSAKERVIPEGTRLEHVFIGRGVLFLDFSKEMVRNHPGGSNAEIMTIYSIVDSICKSFPEIRMVQFLIEGKVVDTLKGHIDVSLPLEPSWKLKARE